MKRARHGVVAIAALASLLGAATCYAKWSATSSVGGTAGSLATTLSAGNAPTVARVGPTDVHVAWLGVLLPDGAGVGGYEVHGYDVTTGNIRTIGGGCVGVVVGVSCTETSVPEGTWRYAITPRQQSWIGAESARSAAVTIDTTAPTVAITFPASLLNYDATLWSAGCVSSICGSAADGSGSGVSSVAVSIRRTSTGLYWNGTSFGSASEVLQTATGTTAWSLSFPASSFPADGAYTVRAVATDANANQSTASTSFTYDAQSPTVAITFPAQGASYSVATWSAACSSSLCGTAADTGSGVASVAVSIRRASTGLYWNGTSFGSATEVFQTAGGATTWTLPFPVSNLPADGTYTVRAVATDGTGKTGTDSATTTVDSTAPAASALTLVNGLAIAGVGLVNPTLDEVTITYSEPLAVSSLSSAWSGDSTDQILNAANDVTVTITNSGSNDVLTVSSASHTLHVGSIALGGNYVTSTATFGGPLLTTVSSVAWTAATRTLTIHIGLLMSGVIGVLAQPAGTAVYTPASGITDAQGNALSTSPVSSTNQRL